jgi:hypothetical protein
VDFRAGTCTFDVRLLKLSTSQASNSKWKFPGENIPHHLRRDRQPARVREYGLYWGGSTNPRQDADASLKHAE